jgi:hypothetical protein
MSLHRDELISQAREMLQGSGMELEDYLKHGETDLALAACDAFVMNGSADESAGDTDGLYHVSRVNRWLIFTDSHGFRDLQEEGSEKEAIARFKSCEEELYPEEGS